jgi:hypothetical protein
MANVHVRPERTFAVTVTLAPPALTGDGAAFSDVTAGRAAVVAAAAELAEAGTVPSNSAAETRPAITSPGRRRLLTSLM